MDAREVYNKVTLTSERLKITDDEWLELESEVTEWLKTNPPIEERRLFTPLGALETIGMMADAVRKKRGLGRYADNKEK